MMTIIIIKLTRLVYIDKRIRPCLESTHNIAVSIGHTIKITVNSCTVKDISTIDNIVGKYGHSISNSMGN